MRLKYGPRTSFLGPYFSFHSRSSSRHTQERALTHPHHHRIKYFLDLSHRDIINSLRNIFSF